MKILQICFRPQIPTNDGGAIAMYNISKGFTAHLEVDLSIFVFNTPKHNIDKLEIEKEFENQSVTDVFIDTSIKPLDAFFHLFSNKSYNIERFNDDKVKSKLQEVLQKESFDLIHFEGLYASPLLETVKKYAPKAKTVLRSHNIEYVIWRRRADQAKNLLQRWYLNSLACKLKSYEDRITPKFDAIVPITDVDKPYFEENGAKNTFTSSTGLDLKNYVACHETAKNSVFHLGSLDWLPNQEAVLWFLEEIWPKVILEVPEATFHLAGKNMPGWFNKYKSEQINVIGEVENAYDFMRNHGIMAVPLLSGSGMRIKIIEGMACACPIVSTSIGAEGIQYKNEENILIANSANEFSNSLINLLKNNNLAESIGKNARVNIKENYSNEALTKDLITFYKSLVH